MTIREEIAFLFVVAAGLFQECGAAIRVEFQRLTEQFLDLMPESGCE